MFTLIAAAALTSLAPDEAAQVERWAKKAKPFATCQTESDCGEKWARAAQWIRDNTRFKILVDQPGLLSTPGAIYANTDLSFTLTLTKGGGGTSSLNVFAWCGNVITCSPKPKSAVDQLRRVVEAPAP
jgi:hypothetical protein